MRLIIAAMPACILLFGNLLLILGTPIAGAHEHWISRERLHDPVTREWCCDERDCFPQTAGAVV